MPPSGRAGSAGSAVCAAGLKRRNVWRPRERPADDRRQVRRGARRKAAQRALVEGRVVVVRDSHAGLLVGVNARLLHALLDAGFLPVVSPPALADDGGAVNVDADRAAAAVAAALDASTLVLLT